MKDLNFEQFSDLFPHLTHEKLRAIVLPFLRKEAEMQQEGSLLAHLETGHSMSHRHTLITMDNPGAYGAVKPILSRLLVDSRSRAVTILASGVARQWFDRDFQGWKDLTNEKGQLLLSLMALARRMPIHSVLGTVTADEGPETIALYGGKSALGAAKIFFMVEGWSGIGAVFRKNREKMDAIDGVICNDDFAEMMICRHFPELKSDQILKIGTPNVEALLQEDGEKLRLAGRARFGLDPDTVAVLYIGDVSEDYDKEYPGTNPDINRDSFALTVGAMKQCAEQNLNRKFALLFRPHPRDTQKADLYAVAHGTEWPDNLVFCDAAVPIPMSEASYAADVVTSIISTENFLAPKRGRLGIFLGYEAGASGGMGGALLRQIYGEIPEEIRKGDLLKVVSTPSEFAEGIGRFVQFSSVSRPQPKTCAGATSRIVELLL